jgi:hypothetical protein
MPAIGDLFDLFNFDQGHEGGVKSQSEEDDCVGCSGRVECDPPLFNYSDGRFANGPSHVALGLLQSHWLPRRAQRAVPLQDPTRNDHELLRAARLVYLDI